MNFNNVVMNRLSEISERLDKFTDQIICLQSHRPSTPPGLIPSEIVNLEKRMNRIEVLLFRMGFEDYEKIDEVIERAKHFVNKDLHTPQNLAFPAAKGSAAYFDIFEVSSEKSTQPELDTGVSPLPSDDGGSENIEFAANSASNDQNTSNIGQDATYGDAVDLPEEVGSKLAGALGGSEDIPLSSDIDKDLSVRVLSAPTSFSQSAPPGDWRALPPSGWSTIHARFRPAWDGVYTDMAGSAESQPGRWQEAELAALRIIFAGGSVAEAMEAQASALSAGSESPIVSPD